MIVDSDNFQEAYKRIHEIINEKKCHCVAMDLEMTGIKTSEPEYKDDLPFEKYSKMRKVAQKFNIIQVGISIFTKEDDEPKYTAYPFNFYVFPKSNQVYSPNIQLQCGSIEFNCKHNMDYNRWIYKGIPYCQKENEQKLKDSIIKGDDDDKFEDSLETQLNKFNPDNQTIMIKETENICAWGNDNEQIDNYIVENDPKYFQRKYLISFVKDKFPNFISKYQDGKLEFIKATQQEKQQHLAGIRLQQEEIADGHLGFLKVMQLIWDKQLPVVGHNCLYDLLFMHQAFYSAIPFSYTQFKEISHKLYPHVYDTKRIASVFFQDILSTTLENIKEYILRFPENFEKPEVKLAEGYTKYDWDIPENSQYFHEAGFDAYLTGWVFIQFKEKLQEKIVQVDNQLPLWNCYYLLNLAGQDVRMNESLIFVAKEKNQTNNNNQNKQNKKLQSNQTVKKIQQKFDQNYYMELLSIRSHAQGSFYFIELFPEGLEQKKETFIKNVISLKSEGLSVQSYQDYILERKQLDDLQNNKGKSNYQNNNNSNQN